MNQSIIATVLGTIVGGLLFIISSVPVIYDSEINHLEYNATIGNVAERVISVDFTQEANLEKIKNQTVYVKGGLSSDEIVQDEAFGIVFPDVLIVEKTLYAYLETTREVEKEIIDSSGNLTTIKSDEKTQSWVKSESPQSDDNISYGIQEREILKFMPSGFKEKGDFRKKKFYSHHFFVKTLCIGTFDFSQALTVKAIAELKQKTKPYAISKKELPTILQNVSVVDGSTLYIRSSLFTQENHAPLTLHDCQEPQVGDLKVTWRVAPKGEIFSVLAKMTDQGLSNHVTKDFKDIDTINVVYKWFKEMEYCPDLTTVSSGSRNIEELIELNKEQNSSNIFSRNFIMWFFLISGFFILFMVPSKFFEWLPFSGILVSANRVIATILAVLLGAVVGLITIACAWFTYHLVYGVIGLIVSVILLYLSVKLLRRRR